jgi:hypothetical protein
LVAVLPVEGKKLYLANRASPVFDEMVRLMAKQRQGDGRWTTECPGSFRGCHAENQS